MNYFDSKNYKTFEHTISKRNGPLVLFGASLAGMLAFGYFQSKNVHVDFFCDNSPKKHNTLLYGVKILSAEMLLELEDATIVITSMFVDEIAAQLQNLGLSNFYVFTKFEYAACIFRYKLQISNLYSIVEDDKSKRVLDSVLVHRITGNYNLYEKVHEGFEYFPKDIINLGEEEVFVDGGAFDGDTSREFIKVTKGEFKEIQAFEPDCENYNKYVDFMKNSMYSYKIYAHEVGIYSANGEVRFNSWGNYGSNIAAESQSGYNSTIKVDSLDNLLLDNGVTYIKLDIEGSEIEAIKGAKKIIQSQKPKLAICIYHNCSDIWEIPLLIKSYVPEYRIYIRQHKSGSYDTATVCYAVI